MERLDDFSKTTTRAYGVVDDDDASDSAERTRLRELPLPVPPQSAADSPLGQTVTRQLQRQARLLELVHRVQNELELDFFPLINSEDCPELTAILGRSTIPVIFAGVNNAGKSKLLNVLLRRDLLYVVDGKGTGRVVRITHGEGLAEGQVTMQVNDALPVAYNLDVAAEAQAFESAQSYPALDQLEQFAGALVTIRTSNALLRCGIDPHDIPGFGDSAVLTAAVQERLRGLHPLVVFIYRSAAFNPQEETCLTEVLGCFPRPPPVLLVCNGVDPTGPENEHEREVFKSPGPGASIEQKRAALREHRAHVRYINARQKVDWLPEHTPQSLANEPTFVCTSALKAAEQLLEDPDSVPPDTADFETKLEALVTNGVDKQLRWCAGRGIEAVFNFFRMTGGIASWDRASIEQASQDMETRARNAQRDMLAVAEVHMRQFAEEARITFEQNKAAVVRSCGQLEMPGLDGVNVGSKFGNGVKMREHERVAVRSGSFDEKVCGETRGIAD